jgi:hypothetical protein
VDEHISSLSTGLGEHYPLTGLTELIWKLDANVGKPHIVILSSNWFGTITVKFRTVDRNFRCAFKEENDDEWYICK